MSKQHVRAHGSDRLTACGFELANVVEPEVLFAV